jgi:hypothetical protein
MNILIKGVADHSQQLSEDLFFSLSDEFDPPVVAVLDPTGQAEQVGESADRITETHALDAASIENVEPLHSRGPFLDQRMDVPEKEYRGDWT